MDRLREDEEMRVGKCPICGGDTKEDIVGVQEMSEGEAYIIKGVKAEVCVQCGERMYSLDEMRRIEKVKLKKRLTIRSENGSESTTVSAEDSSAFDVTADYVNNNNTILNIDCSNNGMESGGSGIALWASSNNFITNNKISFNHTSALPIKNGWINCTEFIDANGKSYNDWIPAIRLE